MTPVPVRSMEPGLCPLRMVPLSYSAKLASIWKMSLPDGFEVSIGSVAERSPTTILQGTHRLAGAALMGSCMLVVYWR